MNIEQIIARYRNKKVINPLRDEQMRTALELEDEKAAVIATLKSPGWKALDKYFNREILLLEGALKAVNPADVDTVRGLQADVRAYGKILNFIESYKNRK